MASQEAPRVEMPKPKVFDGKRDVKELDNFLRKLEQYFLGYHSKGQES